jgi:hypothetical protein
MQEDEALLDVEINRSKGESAASAARCLAVQPQDEQIKRSPRAAQRSSTVLRWGLARCRVAVRWVGVAR